MLWKMDWCLFVYYFTYYNELSNTYLLFIINKIYNRRRANSKNDKIAENRKKYTVQRNSLRTVDFLKQYKRI